MAYQDARDRIKTVLEGLSVTTPLAQSIARVYAEPPGTVQDLPCFVMYGSAAGTVEYSAGGASIEESETEHLRLLIRDADLERAAEFTREYRKALIAAFKSEAGLGAHGLIVRLRWEELSGFRYGNKDHAGQDFFIEFLVLAP